MSVNSEKVKKRLAKKINQHRKDLGLGVNEAGKKAGFDSSRSSNLNRLAVDRFSVHALLDCAEVLGMKVQITVNDEKIY